MKREYKIVDEEPGIVHSCKSCGKEMKIVSTCMYANKGDTHITIDTDYCCPSCDVKYIGHWFYKTEIMTLHRETVEQLLSKWIGNSNIQSKKEVEE